ncbi:MAG: hypothetical protein ACI86H_002222 [bacterium]|jgi:hypothetical protein
MKKLITSLIVSSFLLTNFSSSALFAKVTSKEYKVLLNPTLFKGKKPKSDVKRFWKDLKKQIKKVGKRKTVGKLKFKRNRTIRFYDVPQKCTLKNRNYILRERVYKGKRELSFKTRVSKKPAKNRKKWEKDITLNSKKYSYTQKKKISKSKKIQKFNDIAGLYSEIRKGKFDLQTKLKVVNDLVIREKTYAGAKIKLKKKKAKLTLTLWYSKTKNQPVIAEISFKYKSKKGKFLKKTDKQAKRVLRSIHKMKKWIATKSQTKTAFVYSTGSFCQ